MSDQANEIPCPTCPLCGSEPPYIVPSLAQAICVNEECPVVMWVPWESKDANLADMGKIRVFRNGIEVPDEE